MKSKMTIYQKSLVSMGGIAALFALLFTFSCCKHHESPNTNNTPVDPNQYKDRLVNVNKVLNENEDENIENYITRHGWDMHKTGTGLRYLIYKEGTGDVVVKEKLVVLNYSLSLLDGTEVYNSTELGPKKFVVGQGGVESGLEEGVLLLKVGSKAKLIIPSHLAFGLMGDDNKIPARATLVYDVELIELKDL